MQLIFWRSTLMLGIPLHLVHPRHRRNQMWTVELLLWMSSSLLLVLLLCLATLSHGPRVVTMVVIGTWSQSDKVLMYRFSFTMCIFRFSFTFMLGCLSACKLH